MAQKSSKNRAALPPIVWLATGLGAGFAQRAPGTIGALWGVPLWLAVAAAPSAWLRVGVTAALVAAGVPLCGRAARALAARGLAGDPKDPQAIVWDEFSTLPIVYLALPWPPAGPAQTALWLAAGFALHRALDITKPWPCRRLERLPGGWGIMADDVAAALYAALALRLAGLVLGGGA